jgi:hypothetical protein
MLVLITGIGNVGKSSFRRHKVKELRALGCRVEHYDHDRFFILRHPEDADILNKIPTSFDVNTIYLIEDVNALEEDRALIISKYDFVYYIHSGLLSHMRFWFSRIWSWFVKGEYSWQAGDKWQGTGKKYDVKNIFPILKIFFREIISRKKWIRKDLETLKSCNVNLTMVRSRWSKKGARFTTELS